MLGEPGVVESDTDWPPLTTSPLGVAAFGYVSLNLTASAIVMESATSTVIWSASLTVYFD